LIAGLSLALTLCTAAPAMAQAAVSTADIQRLQDEVYQASADVSRLRTADALQAGRLQDELDTLREDVIYLKVKLRKESSVSRAEYTQLRDQLQDFRSRARRDSRASTGRGSAGIATAGAAPTESTPIYDDRPRPTTTRQVQRGIPVGQEIDVRIQTELTSDNAQVEDRFEATTLVDLSQGDRVLIPAGSVMRGLVTSVNRASRTDRKGSLTVAFNQITVGNRNYPMRGTVTETIESAGIKGEAARIGAGSAVGAIIGGIIGGVKGALLGVLIGGGGTMVATEGKDVTLPAGTILRVRMDTPPEIGGA
jgi:TolA-binding protein